MLHKDKCTIFKRVLNGEAYTKIAKDYNLTSSRISQIFFKLGRILKHHKLMSDEDRQSNGMCYKVAAYRKNKDFWLCQVEAYEKIVTKQENTDVRIHEASGKGTLSDPIVGYRAMCYIEDINFVIIPIAISPLKTDLESVKKAVDKLRRINGANYIYGIQTITASVPVAVTND